jgi:O-antigen/teichoic acid export membrane protein
MKIRRLFTDIAVYGASDVAVSAVSFLLIPIYTRVLTTADFGVFALLLTIEAGSKILLRWGLDTAFIRLYYDCPDKPARETLASSIWWFLTAVNAPLLLAGVVAAPWIGDVLLGTRAHTDTIRIFFLNTFVLGFSFVPFNVYRVEGRSGRFASLMFLRAAGTVVLRLVLVVSFGMGVLGLVLADLILTAVVAACVAPTAASLLRFRFSWPILREALGFGLPRVPHGMAHQVTALSDRWVLNAYLSADQVGVYAIGATFGLSLKLFLSAFGYAWTPFAFEAMNQPAAKDLYRRVTTYVTGLLVLLAAVLAAVAEDLIRLMTAPPFHGAAAVLPWIALGVVCQGFYQTTIVGLSITKRTALMPVATVTAAVVAVAANLLLVPRFGITGAAWSTMGAYLALAVVGYVLSQRVYPVRYDWPKLLTIAAAGGVAYGVAVVVFHDDGSVIARLLLRAITASGIYLGVLTAAGVIRMDELRGLLRDRRRLPSARGMEPPAEVVDLTGEIGTTPSQDEIVSRAQPRKVE